MNVRPIFTVLCSAPLAFALPEGFEMNTFAEPFEVDYPTALTAAGDGTVYVSVDHNGSLGKLPKMGKIVSCRDTDGDGKADQFVDFVASVDSPRGGHFVGDTLYLIHPPFLSSFRDTTGDGVADEHKVLLENIGFGLRHPRGSDHTTNGCRMGIDGWLYIAVGDFGMEGTKGTDGRVVIHRGGAVARVGRARIGCFAEPSCQPAARQTDRPDEHCLQRRVIEGGVCARRCRKTWHRC